MILTIKEKRLLRFLAISHDDYSINDLAKECDLTPSGCHKMLKKLEKEEIVKAKKIANIISYKLNFEGNNTKSILHLVFVPDTLEGRVKLRAQDLGPMKEYTTICILFGSYVTSKQHPSDLDILFVIKKSGYQKYKATLATVRDITPLKIQDVIQTAEDLEENFKKNDPVIIAAIRFGIVLWGFDALVEVIKDAHK